MSCAITVYTTFVVESSAEGLPAITSHLWSSLGITVPGGGGGDSSLQVEFCQHNPLDDTQTAAEHELIFFCKGNIHHPAHHNIDKGHIFLGK